jgi:hypothetical protein
MSFLLACQASVAEVQVGTDMARSPGESQDSNNECNQASNTARAFRPIQWVLTRSPWAATQIETCPV